MELLVNPAENPLPSWHPEISEFITRDIEPSVQRKVSAYHPDVDLSYAAGIGISFSSHPDLYGRILVYLQSNGV
jgi:hypothetical protein